MPRLPRIHLEGAVYLVSCKGLDGETIFKDKADTQMYLELVNRYKGQHGFRLYAYTLLPERLHLLIEPGENATISQIMHDLNSSYTKYFNGRNGRRGHLFESRFKSSLVEKARYLAEATRHVHRQSSSGEPVLSSFDVYVLRQEGGAAQAGPVSIDEEVREVLDFLKNRDNPSQYKRFCLDMPEEESAELEKLFRRSSVVGSPEFAERVQNRIKEHAEERKEASAAAAPSNRLVLFVFGAIVILATATSLYLYVSRQKMEAQYEDLIRQMENKTSVHLLSEDKPGSAPEAPQGGAS